MAQKTKKAKKGAAAMPTTDQVGLLAPLLCCCSLQSLSQAWTTQAIHQPVCMTVMHASSEGQSHLCTGAC